MMTQKERLDYLICELAQERKDYSNHKLTNIEKERVYRSLMNSRMPEPVSSQFLAVQDAYLRKRAEEKGIVDWKTIPTIAEQYGDATPYSDKISIWQGDITSLKIEAIVNAANSQMLGCFIPCHGCIDNAVHTAAGIKLREECSKIMKMQGYPEPTGSAKITNGYNLPAKYVIHTVGPIISAQVTSALEEDLENCYRSCLKTAVENRVRSIAFCCISTGEFRFPNERAAEIAVETVVDVLERDNQQFDRVIFNVFKDIDRYCYRQIFIK